MLMEEHAFSEAHKALLNFRLPSPKGKKILHFGKFSAYFCGYAMFRGAQSALGVASESEITAGRKFFPKADFIVADMAEFLKRNSEKYNVIVVNEPEAVPHDFKTFLPELMERLEPEGCLACRLDVPLSLSLSLSCGNWQQIHRV